MMASKPPTQEYGVRVPKNFRKSFSIMKFNAALNVNPEKWSQVRMEREDNTKEFKADDETPKFGAGSEYGREQREEARRKRYGYGGKKYQPEDQPWHLRLGGKSGKRFRGTREGGVKENASYYIFTQSADGAFEAYPIEDWYNFVPIARFKHLTADEAEEEFVKRDKILNYFSVMRKKLKSDEAGEGEEEEKEKSNKRSSDFKISEMDEWIHSSDEEDEDDDEDGEKKKTKKKGQGNDSDSDAEKKKQKKKKASNQAKKKKEPKGSDDEAVEESDDGDEEGQELDYISDSSSSEEELEKKMDDKGVDQEDGMRKLLTSDEESEEEEGEKEEGDEDEEEGKEEEDAAGEPSSSAKKKKKKKKKKASSAGKDAQEGSSGENSSDGSDLDVDAKATTNSQKKKSSKPNSESGSRPESRQGEANSESGTGSKRKAEEESVGQQIAKKLKTDSSSSASAGPILPPNVLQTASESGLTEETVRRYLMRKPMSGKELLQKFKSKKTGLSSDDLVSLIAHIIKKINPDRKKIKDVMYFSIKA